MGILDLVHGRWIFDRRARALRDGLCAAIPLGARVLDVGCGDGLVDRLIAERRPDLHIEGIDVLVRPHTHVPVTRFDGSRIPHADGSFDVVMFVDVLHHTEDPSSLLREAARVARHAVLVKDHLLSGTLAGPTLRVMDWIGNARHRVILPYNYWTEARWREAFATLDLSPSLWRTDLRLYPYLLEPVFGRSLHCIARLDKRSA